MSHFDIIKVSSDLRHLVFEIRDLDIAFVNSVRRTIISHVPTVGIAFDPYDQASNDIKIAVNRTVLHNELISQRISLVPVCMDENETNSFIAMNYKLTLHEKNTDAAAGAAVHVTTQHIVVYNERDEKYSQELHDKWFPANPLTGDHVLLHKLRPPTSDYPGDELELVAQLSVGTGAQHSRWQPVSACYFRNKIDPDKADAAFEKLGSGFKSRQEFDASDAFRHFYTDDHGEPNRFEFFVESECGLRASYIVFKAMRILQEKLERLLNMARRLGDRTVATKLSLVESFAGVSGCFMFVLSDEDHTIGNLLQSSMFDMYVRSDKRLHFVGYHQPHPLENEIHIKLRVVNLEDDPVQMFTGTCSKLISDIHGYMHDWIVVSGLDRDKIEEVDAFASR